MSPPVRSDHRRVQGRPVPLLKVAARSADVVPLYGHRIWSTPGKDSFEGRAEVRDSGRRRIFGVVREDFEQRATYDRIAFRVSGPKVGIAGVQDGESLVGAEDKE
ncbi:hypothetical protein CDS [Bradyrhizobium sp.]|nr:hypothetical protein CDS [Bradyrhizobium sp.]